MDEDGQDEEELVDDVLAAAVAAAAAAAAAVAAAPAAGGRAVPSERPQGRLQRLRHPLVVQGAQVRVNQIRDPKKNPSIVILGQLSPSVKERGRGSLIFFSQLYIE